MNWQHLFDAAKSLAGLANDAPAGSGRPRQVMLQRAVSTAYYAMFHALCGSNSDTLIGTVPIGPDIGLWLKIYRALGHREAKDRLASYRQQNPVLDIQNFASVFSSTQEQRHNADYNPRRSFSRSEVDRLIARAEAATVAFRKLTAQQRRALATHLLLVIDRSR